MLKIDDSLLKEKYHFYNDRIVVPNEESFLRHSLIRKV